MQEKWIRILIPINHNVKELKSWVTENIRGKYHFKPSQFDSIGWYGQLSIKFEDPADAVAFKLMWL